MKKYVILSTTCLLLLIIPIQAQESASAQTQPPERISSAAEAEYLKKLTSLNRNLNLQGVYIETLDGSMVIADHRSKAAFNPASVIKVATSFAALDRLGPDHTFETAFLAAGEINKKTKTLQGDLVLSSSGDPDLTSAHVAALIKQVIDAGIHRVSGGLVYNSPFTYASYTTTTRAIRNLEALLKKRGIRLAKAARKGAVPPTATVLARHTSKDLREIVFIQNAYSDNVTAERLGEAIGGPAAVEKFLIDTIGIPAAEIEVQRTSGLDRNRITPRGTVQLLRQLVLWLNLRNMLPQDVLPIAGTDVGTLRTRFTSAEYRGAVVGKTGTLPNTDGGVSTLAGFAYTRERGVLVFAIFNTGANVNRARVLQDAYLKDLIVESGGAEVNASLRRSSN